MSNPGLVFQVHDPQGAHGFDDEIIEFVGVGATAGESYRLEAIYSMAGGVPLNKGVVAGFLHFGCDFVEGIVPGDIFPIGAAGAADLWLQQAAIVQDILFERSAFGAKCAAINRMIRVAFDVNHLRCDVFRAITNRVDDDASTHRTVRTSGAGFVGSGNLESAKLRVGGLQVETEDGRSRATDRRKLQKITPRRIHR